MINRWELIEAPNNGFVAYLCITTALSVLKQRKSQPSAKTGNIILMTDIPETANADDVVKAGEHAYILRLPYSEAMLARRAGRGDDVPAWWQSERDALLAAGAVLKEAV